MLMGIIKNISKKQILQTALRLVGKSKKTLHLTMFMEEELYNSSQKYVRFLRKKISQGILVKRIGFGTKSQYKSALKQLGLIKLPKNFHFLYSISKNIQRLLISDKKEMLFAVYTGNRSKIVCFTKSHLIVKAFLNYFNNITKTAEK